MADNAVLSDAMNTQAGMNPLAARPVKMPKLQIATQPAVDIKKDIEEQQAFAKPYEQEVQRLSSEQAKFEAEKALSESQKGIIEAQGTVNAQEKYAEAMRMRDLEAKRKDLEEQMGKPFVPTSENAQEIATLFSLINVVGFAMGAGGKGNAQQAMSAMNGMLEGHQKGRDDIYKKEKDIFEENLKVLKNKWDALLADMERAAKVAETDLATGTAQARLAAAQYGANFVKDNIDKFGLMASLENARKSHEAAVKMYDTATKHKQDVDSKNIETRNQYYKTVYEGELKILDRQLQSENERFKQLAGIGGEGYALQNMYNMPPQEIARLGKEELPIVANKVEAARVTTELANLIQNNPNSVGLAGQFLNNIDKYLPSRYDKEDALTNDSIIKNNIDQDQSINGSPDEITAARIIAKKALDVINARALSVSKRLLVAELKMQKEVLDPKSMAGKTAPYVYRELAKSDIDSLIKYGISDQTRGSLNNRFGLGKESTMEATEDDIAATMKANNLSRDEVIKRLKAKGYTVPGG